MKKISQIAIIFCLLFPVGAFAQEGYFVEKDSRIEKYEKNIVEFLIQRKQLVIQKETKEEDFFKNQIIVSKSIEIYSDTTKVKLLLIRFSNVSDHGDKYYGILTDNEQYFFYDTKEIQFKAFSKRYDSLSTSTIKFFCDRFEKL